MEISLSTLGIKENKIEKIQLFEKLNINTFHIDLMDGEFVEKNTEKDMIENISIISSFSHTPCDVHIMAKKENIKKYIDMFSSYNPNSIGFHIEAFNEIDEDQRKYEIEKYIKYIYYLKSKPFLVINEETDLKEVLEFLPKIYKILLMSVTPGDGGRDFKYGVLEKIKFLRKYIDENKLDTFIEVDGSINQKTIKLVENAGADIVSVGSFLTNEGNLKRNLERKIEILKGEKNMLVNTKEMLLKANKEGYAVGAFNISDMESIQAIIKASSENNSPVIIQTSKSAIEYMGFKYIYSMVTAAAENENIDIALHLDHGADFEICKKAIDEGWTSVMIDASSKPFEENVEITKKVVEYAHPRGVTVEAELGRLAGIEDEVNVSHEDAIYTDPNEAKKFVELTGVDSIAIAIGTSHGAYKFKGDAKLRIDILKEVKKLMPDMPIVLHGASTVIHELVETINEYGGDMPEAKGVPDEMLNEAAKNGVSKINVDTDLRLAMTSEIRKYLAENKEDFTPRNYCKKGREKMYEVVKHKQKDVFLSQNKG